MVLVLKCVCTCWYFHLQWPFPVVLTELQSWLKVWVTNGTVGRPTLPPLPLFLPSLSFSLSFYFSLLLFSSHTHRVTLAVCEASLCPWGVCFYPLINNTMDRVSLSAVWRHLSYWGNVSSSSRRLYLLDSFLLLFYFLFLHVKRCDGIIWSCLLNNS